MVEDDGHPTTIIFIVDVSRDDCVFWLQTDAVDTVTWNLFFLKSFLWVVRSTAFFTRGVLLFW
jgi:hypothetical protein